MPTHVSFEDKAKQLNYVLKGVITLKIMIKNQEYIDPNNNRNLIDLDRNLIEIRRFPF